MAAERLDHNQVTISNSAATQIVGERGGRKEVTIQNEDSSIAVYVGGSSVTSSTGLKLAAGASITLRHQGAIYARAASGSPAVSYLDQS